MEGDITGAMAKGIDNSAIVLVFITQRFVKKVASDNSGDNCKRYVPASPVANPV